MKKEYIYYSRKYNKLGITPCKSEWYFRDDRAIYIGEL